MSKSIITCASYGGSGSSVITDLLKEFDNIYSTGEFEFTIAHELDGISDLEYYLVNNTHRLNCDQAIYRFKNLLNKIEPQYSKYINRFSIISNQYIDDIIECSWQGSWHRQRERYSKGKQYLYYNIPNKIKKIKNKIKKSEYEIVIKSRREPMYYSNLGDEFYEKTKRYTRNLIDNVVIKEKKEINKIVMDQLVPTNNIDRYINYFENIKIIIVDRDPRDLFLLNKLYWNEGWIPTDDIEIFIRWFKGTRDNYRGINDSKKCLLIKFEDFIYNYEDTLEKIRDFLDLDLSMHKDKKKYFNPNISKKNSGLWRNNKEYRDEVLLIEKELAQYCYRGNTSVR